jgi:hypothetical protein
LESRDSQFYRGIERIVSLLAPVNCKHNLIRIGQESDGGYVVANCFHAEKRKIAVTLGVGTEVSADISLLRSGFSVLAVDGTVENPLPEEAEYRFIKKNIGYSNLIGGETTYYKLLEDERLRDNVDLVLIDIEGYEYSLIRNEIKYLSKAEQIVIEFHALELLGDKQFREVFISILESIRITHSPIHVHGNNAGGALVLGGSHFPCILEVTFLKTNYCTQERNFGPFPTPLDFPNTINRPDIDLSPLFRRNPEYATLARNVINDLDL